jgi:hypothetical protein
MTVRGFKPKPVSATPAPEPPAPEESTPKGPAPKTNTTLPDLPCSEPQQAEARAGGGEQVEALEAAHADGIGNCLTPHGLLLKLQTLCTECILTRRYPATTF